jgi:thiamine biosynthesis lipoprotein
MADRTGGGHRFGGAAARRPRAGAARAARAHQELVMWTFHAMNTAIAVAAPELSDDAERELALSAERLFRETELRFSRFLPGSELSQLNRAHRPVVVSEEMLSLLVRARAHCEATGGLFEPAVGGALPACGYDRSFEPGVLDRGEEPAASPYASIRMLDIDEPHRRVARPAHVQIDFGGFLKGLTADRAAALATSAVMIDAGGDAVVRGAPPGQAGWIIEIEDPLDPARTVGTIAVRDQAVATSAANRRRWRRGSQAMHHLIDPATRAPARTDVVQATVFAPTAELADVMAKVAFLRGAGVAVHELERRQLAAVLVLDGGAVRTTGAVELHHA